MDFHKKIILRNWAIVDENCHFCRYKLNAKYVKIMIEIW